MSTKKIKYSTQEAEKDFGPITFADLMLAHRESEELTQVQMAALLGISKQSLCDIEKGRKIPSPERAALMAEKLGMIPQSFIQLALQDQLTNAGINYTVKIEAA